MIQYKDCKVVFEEKRVCVFGQEGRKKAQTDAGRVGSWAEQEIAELSL